MIEPVRIAVVGSGYDGLVAAVGLAEIRHQVVCVDNDQQKVTALQSGQIPIHEQYLPELLQRHRNRNIRFTTDLAEAMRSCEALFIAAGTPPGVNGDADLSCVEAVAAGIAGSEAHGFTYCCAGRLLVCPDTAEDRIVAPMAGVLRKKDRMSDSLELQ